MLVGRREQQDSSSGGGNGGGDNGGSASGGKEAAEITIWAWDPNFNIKALNIAKERYSKINPDVKINIVENAQADIIQKLNTGLGSGTTRGLPNIVLIEDYRAQSFLKAFPDMFYELTDTFNCEPTSPSTRSDRRAWTDATTACLSTPASPDCSSARTIWRKPASRRITCRR